MKCCSVFVYIIKQGFIVLLILYTSVHPIVCVFFWFVFLYCVLLAHVLCRRFVDILLHYIAASVTDVRESNECRFCPSLSLSILTKTELHCRYSFTLHYSVCH